MFKKKKIKTNKKPIKVSSIIFFILAFFVFVAGIFAYNSSKNFDFFNKQNFDYEHKIEDIENNSNLSFEEKQDLIEKEKQRIKEENEKKLQENKINILLVGRGGRLNDAPNLTDSIILASINKQEKTISMFSIPRDLYVQYKNGKYGRINKIYALTHHKTGSIEAGMDDLKYNVELITGEKIDYYVNIDFLGFIKFIDAIGGIKITVPKKLVDYKFPDNNWGYRTFVIRKGTWNFSGETALNYARSRHSTSDFDRSLRQQQILKAIKDKLLEGGFFDKLGRVKEFYKVFTKYVETDIGLADAINIFDEINGKDFKILSSNLNDSCFEGDDMCKKGGFLYVPQKDLYGGAAILLVNGSELGKINNYEKISKYLDIVFNKPQIYKENFEINIFNATKVPLLAGNTAFNLRKYGLNIPFEKKVISNLKGKKIKNSIINYVSEIKNSETIKFLKEIFPDLVFNEVPELENSLRKNTKIEIIIGEDYEKLQNDLKNNL